MEGIAKSAPVESGPVKHVVDGGHLETQAQPIHPEVYKYFNIEPGSSSDTQLKTIYEWGMQSGDTGKAMKKLKDLEIHLGQPAVGETRLSKLYNFIRLSNNVSNKEYELRDAVDGAVTKHKLMLSELKNTFKDKVFKINEELSKLTNEYKKARDAYNRTASERALTMRKVFAGQIEQLKSMRDAYKGGIK